MTQSGRKDDKKQQTGYRGKHKQRYGRRRSGTSHEGQTGTIRITWRQPDRHNVTNIINLQINLHEVFRHVKQSILRRRTCEQESDCGAGEEERKTEVDNIEKDLSERDLPREEAHDRVKWRRPIKNTEPT